MGSFTNLTRTTTRCRGKIRFMCFTVLFHVVFQGIWQSWKTQRKVKENGLSWEDSKIRDLGCICTPTLTAMTWRDCEFLFLFRYWNYISLRAMHQKVSLAQHYTKDLLEIQVYILHSESEAWCMWRGSNICSLITSMILIGVWSWSILSHRIVV